MMKNTGFTLIELMIVVAIVGVLSAIAIPSYQGYIVKTQINRAVGELATYKASFEGQVGTGGSVSNSDLGYTPSNLTTGTLAANIGTLNPDGSGQLQVTMGGKAHPNVAGLILRFVRSSSGSWGCVVDNAAVSSWKPVYLPAGCGLH